MIDKSLTYAVIGASNHPEKYGHKVLVDLHQAGYKVIPVNPREGLIAGLKAYPDLEAITEKVDVAIYVVPPGVTEKILVQAVNKGVKKVWLQPGSDSLKAFDYCRDNGLECVHDACIMVEKNKA